MELIKALNKMITWIPFQREEEQAIADTLKCKFTEYITLLKTVDEEDLTKLFAKQKLFCKKMGKQEFINLIDKIQKTIENAISIYTEGNPSQAYMYIESLLSKNKFISMNNNRKPQYANNKLTEPLEHYFQFELKSENNDENYFRMRISNTVLSKKDMFHIPFNLCELVRTQRFSIPGYPCLYLGTSLEVCWDEIKREREKKEKIYACKFRKKADKTLVLLNLRIPNKFTQKNLYDYSTLCFLLTFPFYLSCLVQTKYPDKPFKPEYIIPQILLQYVNVAFDNCTTRFDGIIYSSTKSIPFKGNKYNLVFPFRFNGEKDKNYSSKLIETLPYTDPITVNPEKMKDTEKELKKLEMSSLK